MAQKNATPTGEQMEAMTRAGLNPEDWVVIRDLRYRMIIRSRVTNEVKMIGK